MCTSMTENLSISGFARGEEGRWTRISAAAVYYDHPVRATSDHAVVLDLHDAAGPLSSRVVVEMSAASAAELAEAIGRVLSTEPARRELAESGLVR